MLPLFHGSFPMHSVSTGNIGRNRHRQRTLSDEADDVGAERARQLAIRFAQMLNQRRQSRPSTSSLAATSATTTTIASSKHNKRTSKRGRNRSRATKNCMWQRREIRKSMQLLQLTANPTTTTENDEKSSSQWRSDGGVSESEQSEEALVDDEDGFAIDLVRLQNQAAGMERSTFLHDSALLTWRSNRTAVAVALCKANFDMISHGYNPCDGSAHSLVTKHFIESVYEDDLLCRDFQGRQHQLDQLEQYTVLHDRFQIGLRAITLIDEQDARVSIRIKAEISVVISMKTLQIIYPAFYNELATDNHARAIADKLVGKELAIVLDMVMHFNQHGRIFAHESRVHMVSALLNVLGDPIATMRLIDASLVTQDGHVKIEEDSEMPRRLKTLPSPML